MKATKMTVGLVTAIAMLCLAMPAQALQSILEFNVPGDRPPVTDPLWSLRFSMKKAKISKVNIRSYINRKGCVPHLFVPARQSFSSPPGHLRLLLANIWPKTFIRQFSRLPLALPPRPSKPAPGKGPCSCCPIHLPR